MSLDSKPPLVWADWNFHAASLALVQRIKEVSQNGPNAWARIVGTRDDLASVTEANQVTPGVYVLYRGFAVLNADKHNAEIEHRWFVVLSVSGAANAKEPAAKDAEAGRYLPQLLKALHGWVPDGCTTPLLPMTPPPPRPSENGRYSYYPLAFKASTIYSTRNGPAVGPLPLDRKYP